MRPALNVVVLASLATAMFATAAPACEFAGYTKNGERRCATTYVYKKSKSYTDASAYKKPAEQCRATCLRDAMKWGTSEQQTAYFNMCTRNQGCQ